MLDRAAFFREFLGRRGSTSIFLGELCPNWSAPLILSFANTGAQTERIWNGQRSKRVPDDIQRRALAKLRMLDAAETIDDLRNPPGNRLHELKGDRAGQHSISINRQWRICFRFKDGNAHDVEIVDYHD